MSYPPPDPDPDQPQPPHGQPPSDPTNPYGQYGQHKPPGQQQQPPGQQQQPPGGYGQQQPPGGYGQQQGGYGPHPQGGYGQQPQNTNVMAILSLVFAFVFAPAGIVLGHLAKRQIKQTGEPGDQLATWGLILSYVFTALYLAGCCAWIGVLLWAGSSGNGNY